MFADVRQGVALGVAEKRAAIAVPTPKPAPGTAFPPRRLQLDGKAVFELNLWCGTCPALFKKLAEPQRADLEVANDRLSATMERIDDSVLQAYGQVMPRSEYTVLLLEVSPQLVEPGSASDYFTHEQVATWGADPAGGSLDDPGSRRGGDRSGVLTARRDRTRGGRGRVPLPALGPDPLPPGRAPQGRGRCGSGPPGSTLGVCR